MKYLPFFLLLFSTSFSHERFFEANEAFQSGKFEAALQKLDSIKSTSFAKNINLGYTYLELKNINQAWLYFERAKQINPYSKEITKAFNSLPNSLSKSTFIPSLQTWFWLQILSVSAAILGLVIAVSLLRQIHKKQFKFKLLIFFCISLILLVIPGFYAHKVRNKAIISQNDVSLYVSPSEHSSELIQIHEPQGVTVLQKHGDYVYVEIFGMKTLGWIHKKYISPILF